MALWCFKHSTTNPFGVSQRIYKLFGPERSEASAESPEKSRDAAVARINASDKLLPDTKEMWGNALAKAKGDELELWLKTIEDMEAPENVDRFFADMQSAEHQPLGAAIAKLLEERTEIYKNQVLTLADFDRIKDLDKKIQEVQEVGEKLEAANLLPASVEHLNQVLGESTLSESHVIVDTIDDAITQIQAIERLSDVLSPADQALAWEQFDAAYEDFVINPDEMRSLARVRQEASDRVDLRAAHMVDNLEMLKAYALLFVRDPDGKPLHLLESGLSDNTTFTIDFRDESGKINKFAQAKLTLGHILQAVGRDSIKVKKTSGTETMAYLHTNGKTYSRPGGKGSYVEILQGYTLTTPEKESAPALAAAPEAEPVPTRVATNPDFVAGEEWMTEEERAQVEAERELYEQEGALTYRDPGDIYVGSADDPMTLDATVSVSTAEIPLASLRDRTVDVPGHFRGENSYEQIAKLKYTEGGQDLYDAVRMMAAIYREVQGPIDNRNMWKKLHGGIFSRGGRFTMSFNEMAKAVYGKNEDKLTDGLPYMDHFKKAAQTLLDRLDEAEETGTSPESFRQMRESTEYSGEKAVMANVTEQVFERNSYGPPVSGNALQLIVWSLPGVQRPTITKDSWMTPASNSRLARGYKQYGEVEVISHARAFDKMMESGDLEEYRRLINNYLVLGRDQVNLEYEAFGFTRPLDAREVTAADLADPNFTLSEDQIIAIRHGAMRFAAIELGVLQRVEEERTELDAHAAARELAEDLAQQAAAGQNLDAAQTQELQDELEQKIYLMLSGMVAAQPGEDENGDATVDWMGEIAAGVGIPILPNKIPGNLILEWTISGNTIVPHLRTSAGLVYRIDVGKMGRGHFEAFAKFSWGLTEPEGYIGPHLGIGYSHDMNESGTWALGGGVGLGLREDGNILTGHVSADFDQGARLRKKVRDFKENPEVKAKLEESRAEAYRSIDSLQVDRVQKEALKKQYDKYIDQRIASELTRQFVGSAEGQNIVERVLAQIKVVSVGVTAAVGLKEGGFALGPYITIGIGFRAVTLYVPPLETPDQVARSMETGLPTGIENYIPPEADWVRVTVDDQVLWNGDEGARDLAIARAQEQASTALDAMEQGIADDATLTPGEKFTNIDFKKFNGTVKLYVDSRSGIETIKDGPEDIALNLDSSDDLVIRILEVPASYGGENIILVGITDLPGASINDIVQNSGNYLTWSQTPDGRKSHSTLADNPAAPGAGKLIYTMEEANRRLADGSLALGDLTPEGAKQNVREVRYDEVRAREGVREARLFEGMSEAERQTASEVADLLVKREGFNYDRLASGGENERINAKVIELYQEKGISSPSIKQIFLARQYAMQIDRPDATRVPLEWNKKRLQEIAGDFSRLSKEYLDKNKDQLRNMNGTFPEGTEFFIFISESGQAELLQGYYDANVHGSIVAPIEWDAANPAETLEALGFDEAGQQDPDNQASVREMAMAIDKLSWEESPFNSVEGANFEEATQTMAGALLATHALDIYGSDDGAKIRSMVHSGNGSLFPELADEFARDVARLLGSASLSDGEGTVVMIRGIPVTMEWEVRTGLYQKCFNLVCGRNLVLKYQTPPRKAVQSASTRETIEEGMTPEAQARYATMRLAPGVIPVRPGSEVTTPAQTDADEQNPLQPGQNPRDFLGQQTPGSGAENEQDTSF